MDGAYRELTEAIGGLTEAIGGQTAAGRRSVDHG